jgi:hypothetical protein
VGALLAADGAAKTAIRVKRDVGQESTVGATMTGIHDGASFSNLVSGDARIRLSDKTVLTGQLAGTFADSGETGGRCSSRCLTLLRTAL